MQLLHGLHPLFRSPLLPFSPFVCFVHRLRSFPPFFFPPAAHSPQVVTRLSDGTGNFDAERMLQQLPADLGIDAGKAAATVEELAKARKQTTLVQVGAGCWLMLGWCWLGGLVGVLQHNPCAFNESR